MSRVLISMDGSKAVKIEADSGNAASTVPNPSSVSSMVRSPSFCHILRTVLLGRRFFYSDFTSRAGLTSCMPLLFSRINNEDPSLLQNTHVILPTDTLRTVPSDTKEDTKRTSPENSNNNQSQTTEKVFTLPTSPSNASIAPSQSWSTKDNQKTVSLQLEPNAPFIASEIQISTSPSAKFASSSSSQQVGLPRLDLSTPPMTPNFSAAVPSSNPASPSNMFCSASLLDRATSKAIASTPKSSAAVPALDISRTESQPTLGRIHSFSLSDAVASVNTSKDTLQYSRSSRAQAPSSASAPTNSSLATGTTGSRSDSVSGQDMQIIASAPVRWEQSNISNDDHHDHLDGLGDLDDHKLSASFSLDQHAADFGNVSNMSNMSQSIPSFHGAQPAQLPTQTATAILNSQYPNGIGSVEKSLFFATQDPVTYLTASTGSGSGSGMASLQTVTHTSVLTTKSGYLGKYIFSLFGDNWPLRYFQISGCMLLYRLTPDAQIRGSMDLSRASLFIEKTHRDMKGKSKSERVPSDTYLASDQWAEEYVVFRVSDLQTGDSFRLSCDPDHAKLWIRALYVTITKARAEAAAINALYRTARKNQEKILASLRTGELDLSSSVKLSTSTADVAAGTDSNLKSKSGENVLVKDILDVSLYSQNKFRSKEPEMDKLLDSLVDSSLSNNNGTTSPKDIVLVSAPPAGQKDQAVSSLQSSSSSSTSTSTSTSNDDLVKLDTTTKSKKRQKNALATKSSQLADSPTPSTSVFDNLINKNTTLIIIFIIILCILHGVLILEIVNHRDGLHSEEREIFNEDGTVQAIAKKSVYQDVLIVIDDVYQFVHSFFQNE